MLTLKNAFKLLCITPSISRTFVVFPINIYFYAHFPDTERLEEGKMPIQVNQISKLKTPLQYTSFKLPYNDTKVQGQAKLKFFCFHEILVFNLASSITQTQALKYSSNSTSSFYILKCFFFKFIFLVPFKLILKSKEQKSLKFLEQKGKKN